MEWNKGLQAPSFFLGGLSLLGLLLVIPGLWSAGGSPALGTLLILVGVLGGTAWGLDNLRNEGAEHSADE